MFKHLAHQWYFYDENKEISTLQLCHRSSYLMKYKKKSQVTFD